MEWLADYGLFLAKAFTVLVFLALAAGFVAALAGRNAQTQGGRLQTEDLSKKYRRIRQALSSGIDRPRMVDPEPDDKKHRRAQKKRDKKPRPTVFVLDFVGDVGASSVTCLREEISAAILAAHNGDEVLVRLDSPGGSVTGYGLVAAQLNRIRQADIPLTVAVNQVAASGGYLAACVADRILAAPFAIIGSIGVVLQLPNLNRLLKEHHIDFEQLTAGRNKRNLTVFGENDDQSRERAQEQLQGIHRAFIAEVAGHRPDIDLKKVTEGDIWLASEALELKLVDELGTSDDWLLARLGTHRLIHLRWQRRQPPLSRRLPRALLQKFLNPFFEEHHGI